MVLKIYKKKSTWHNECRKHLCLLFSCTVGRFKYFKLNLGQGKSIEKLHFYAAKHHPILKWINVNLHFSSYLLEKKKTTVPISPTVRAKPDGKDCPCPCPISRALSDLTACAVCWTGKPRLVRCRAVKVRSLLRGKNDGSEVFPSSRVPCVETRALLCRSGFFLRWNVLHFCIADTGTDAPASGLLHALLTR